MKRGNGYNPSLQSEGEEDEDDLSSIDDLEGVHCGLRLDPFT